jgi:D-citramalate synthase
MYLHKPLVFMLMVTIKNNLYFNDLLPERFGRKRQYALGKHLVKQISKRTLQELGLKLNQEDIKLVTQRIIN